MYFSTDLLTTLKKLRNEEYQFDFIDDLINYKNNKDFLFIDVSDKVDYVSFIPNKKEYFENLTYMLLKPTTVGIDHSVYITAVKMIEDKSKITIDYSYSDSYKILGKYPAYGEWLNQYDVIHMENMVDGKQILNLQKYDEPSIITPIFEKVLPKQELKIGRFISKFTSSLIENKITELFVNNFKALNLFEKNINDYFSIVEGEDIKFWYSKENYAQNCGILNSSCMRLDECQDYFNIYMNNDVKMILLKDFSGKLLGRALLWETTKGKYIDRIYGQEHTIKAFDKWAIANGYEINFNNRSNLNDLYVNININLNDKVPYLDTFRYMTIENIDSEKFGKAILMQKPPETLPYYILGNTNGSYKIQND